MPHLGYGTFSTRLGIDFTSAKHMFLTGTPSSYVGTPVALGIAYWYYKKKNSKNSKKLCDGVYENTKTRTLPKELNNVIRRTVDKAIEYYTSAIEIRPPEKSEDLSTFYQNRAAAYENLNNYEAVINDTTKALEYNTSYLKALYRRTKAYEELGEWHNEDPIMKSVEEYKKNKKDPSELSGFRLVIHHLAEENFDEIIPNFDVEINRREPNLPETLLVRATFKLLQG
ncbi:mitochondrial import receptor subunit TOM70 [Trichonephila clavipes]|uniref:Mitochondrial import receptor subunit TOM70 n=1 Tax=Trichonephila clavipes TaxID=2585209 RepID=A0A8X6RAW7_TRICX|nr:mitochondrial import receptor subunit TOM70 [Trichonephila clavipes]